MVKKEQAYKKAKEIKKSLIKTCQKAGFSLSYMIFFHAETLASILTEKKPSAF